MCEKSWTVDILYIFYLLLACQNLYVVYSISLVPVTGIIHI